jgi:hypothetical protein
VNARRSRTVGSLLFAATVLVFVALPFWIFSVFDSLPRIGEAVAVTHFPAPTLLLWLLVMLPLLIVAILWTVFLIAPLFSNRPRPGQSSPRAGRSEKARATLLVLAGTAALAITVFVELEYPTWIGGAALGSAVDVSLSAPWHFGIFIEVPQLFLIVLWTPLLLTGLVPRPNSPAAILRLSVPIGFLLVAVTGLVWLGYPDWMSGVGIISDADKQIPTAVFSALKGVPALFIACVWLCFLSFVGSSLRARSRRSLDPA